MHIYIGSDESNQTTDAVLEYLTKRKFSFTMYGALLPEPAFDELSDSDLWPDVALTVSKAVQCRMDSSGILFCFSGTGVCMVANKVKGIRAALCADAETAKAAKRWNDANVLVMSLRFTTPTVALEILETWFSTQMDRTDLVNVKCVSKLYDMDSMLFNENSSVNN